MLSLHPGPVPAAAEPLPSWASGTSSTQSRVPQDTATFGDISRGRAGSHLKLIFKLF